MLALAWGSRRHAPRLPGSTVRRPCVLSIHSPFARRSSDSRSGWTIAGALPRLSLSAAGSLHGCASVIPSDGEPAAACGQTNGSHSHPRFERPIRTPSQPTTALSTKGIPHFCRPLIRARALTPRRRETSPRNRDSSIQGLPTTASFSHRLRRLAQISGEEHTACHCEERRNPAISPTDSRQPTTDYRLPMRNRR